MIPIAHALDHLAVAIVVGAGLITLALLAPRSLAWKSEP